MDQLGNDMKKVLDILLPSILMIVAVVAYCIVVIKVAIKIFGDKEE